MGSFGGYYKGDKKKQKVNKGKGQNTASSDRPSYVMPEIIIKKKKE